MARIDIAAALDRSALFRALPQEERAALARGAAVRQVEAEALLFARGERGEAVLWLILGEGPLVQVAFDGPGGRVARLGYRLLGGEVAGDIDLLLGGLQVPMPPRLATARALVAHRALALPAEAVAAAAERNPAFRRRLIRDAARRLADLLGQAGAAGPVPPDVAFAGALLDLFDDFGAPGGGPQAGLARRLSQKEAAELMGMSLRSFSARATDWAARGLIDSAPLILLDRGRVERIAAAAGAPAAGALEAAEAEAAALIAGGQRQRGAGMAADALALWPGNPALLFLLALAAARSGDDVQAARLLAHPALRFDGGMGDLRARVIAGWRASLGPEGEELQLPEARVSALCRDIAALQARLAKDAALALPAGAARAAALARAAAVYAAVDAALPGAHPAVNAASLLWLAGEAGASARMARRAAALAAGEGHWDLATRAEAALLLGAKEEALVLYRRAVAGAGPGDAGVIRRQVAHLAAGGLAGAGDCLAATDLGPVLLMSGPVLARGRAAEADLAAAAQRIEAEVADWLQGRAVSGLICSLASGADLIAARAAMAAGIAVDAVLPFAPEVFLRSSVDIGGGRDWRAMFAEALPGLRSLTVLWEGEAPPFGWPAHFARTDAVMLGEAVLAADRLATGIEVLAIGDAGSAAAGLAAAAGRHAQVTLRSRAAPLAGPRRGALAPTGGPFAGVILVQAHDALPATRDWLVAEGMAPRMTKARRLLGARVVGDLAAAAVSARDLALRAEERGAQVALDHGPVLLRSGGTDDAALARMAAGLTGGLSGGTTGGVLASPGAALALLGAGRARVAEIVVDPSDSGGTATRRLFRLI